eukprot:scaffold7346_cov245-Pinguiococcus_pyrenoidosus.AAC.15
MTRFEGLDDQIGEIDEPSADEEPPEGQEHKAHTDGESEEDAPPRICRSHGCAPDYNRVEEVARHQVGPLGHGQWDQVCRLHGGSHGLQVRGGEKEEAGVEQNGRIHDEEAEVEVDEAPFPFRIDQVDGHRPSLQSRQDKLLQRSPLEHVPHVLPSHVVDCDATEMNGQHEGEDGIVHEQGDLAKAQARLLLRGLGGGKELARRLRDPVLVPRAWQRYAPDDATVGHREPPISVLQSPGDRTPLRFLRACPRTRRIPAFGGLRSHRIP